MDNEQLYERIERIVLKQGNVFIRELLRSKKLSIGANKEQFEAALKQAIDSGDLKGEDLDDWIKRVEGWGNQHVYPFEVPKGIAATNSFDSAAAAEGLIRSNRLGQYWSASNSRVFPEEPELTGVSFDEASRVMMFEWHVRAPGWVRDKTQDIEEKEIEGDIYRFDAFRRQPGRIVTRFVLRIPDDGDRALAALLVRQGVRTSDHAKAVQKAWADLGKVTVGSQRLGSIQANPWFLSDVIKKVDSAVVRKDKALERYQVRSTKLTHKAAAVQFTNSAKGPLPEAVMNVRLAIKPKTLRDQFEASTGEFGVEADPDRSASRRTRIYFYPPEGRIRIASELDREDVWNILLTLDAVR